MLLCKRRTRWKQAFIIYLAFDRYCTCDSTHAIALSAGLNDIQVDQVNREDSSRAGVPDKCRWEHILSWTKLFAIAITLGYTCSCYKSTSSLFTQNPCFFSSVHDDLCISVKGYVFIAPGPLGTPHNHTKNLCTTLPVVHHFRLSHDFVQANVHTCVVVLLPYFARSNKLDTQV